MKVVSAGAVLALALFSPLWAANDLSAVFAKMDEAAPKFKGMRADVKRVSHVAIMPGDDTTDSGTILVRVPKPHDYHMLIDFQQPDKKTVELAGTTVRIYYPKSNEVQVKNLGKENKGLVEQFMKLGFGSNSKELQQAYTISYEGEDTAAGQKTWKIALVPKSPDLASTFSKFELWISQANGISVQQKMYENGGNYTIATYPNMKLDANIPESAVKLNPPKGAAIRPL